MNHFRNRILVVFVGFCFFFLIVLGKAFKIQVFDKDGLIERSKKQTFRSRKVYPKRGNIYDRNGKPLAINIQTYSIFVIPKNLKSKNKTYKKLSGIVPSMTFRVIQRKIKKRNRFTWLARKIELTKGQVQKIKKLKGIYIEAVPKRLYPNNELSSQLLGFVGIDNVGLSGIEYMFDKELRGSPRSVKYIKDNKGRPVKFTSVEVGDEAHDIHLTIDKDLQSVSEKYLKDAVDKYKAIGGSVGVLDVSTGEILAMASYPTFDPNRVRSSERESRRLSFVTDPIEPGSVFKIFTAASALVNEVARPNTNYFCEQGRLQVEGHYIKEADTNKKFEWLSVSDIIKYSSNIGTTKIAFDLTYPKLLETLKDFSIGEKTEIEVPGESRGILPNKKNVSPLSLSNISFGQGIATTGIQILSAYGAIANDGIYIKPTLLKKKEKRVGKRILPKKIAAELIEMLVGVVEDGTGSRARIPYFKIAGKTSTGQKPNKAGGYSGYIPGFVGFPVNVEKRFVIYVYIDEPQGYNYFGNAVAAPVFKKIAQHILYKNKSFKSLVALKKTRSKKVFGKVETGNSKKRYMGSDKVPNFIGLDKKSAERLAKKIKLKISYKGIGIVKSQSLKAGDKIPSQKVIKLIYSPPSYE